MQKYTDTLMEKWSSIRCMCTGNDITGVQPNSAERDVEI